MKNLKLLTSIFIFILSVITMNLFAKDPGEKVDDFTIKNFDGKSYVLSNSDAKYTVIMFWSSECPYVQPFNDRINEFVKGYQDKGIAFWAVNANSTEPVEQVKSHAEKHSYVFPMLKDENNVVADIFGATRTPEVFVLDKNRVILYHGRIDDNSYQEKVTSHDLKNALDELLAGKEVSVKSTKSFGCGIKRVNQ